MSWKPEVIVKDYETGLLPDGTPSTEYYRDDFRALSCAFAWFGPDGTVKTKFLLGEEAIGTFVRRCADEGIPLVVHNLQFEYGVALYRFPGTEHAVQIDTMRLVQVADNGGTLAFVAENYEGIQTYDALLDKVAREEDADSEENAMPVEPYPGLGLQAATSRHLPAEFQNHKEPFYAVIRERTQCKAGSEGQHLDALTPDELERYNVADAVVTLHLYKKLTDDFKAEGYDWRLDHTLYRESARRIAKAKGMGIHVDREAIAAYREDVLQEMRAIEDKFRAAFLVPILELEEAARDKWVGQPKTERGRANRAENAKPEQFLFNVGSNKQLAALFVGKLKMSPKFTTKTGQPSFKSAFLSQWGEGGEMLKKRRKRLLVLKQCESLLALSAYDGKWHVDLKACGTTTGRFAGGKV